jgi:hypothetical protein
VVHPLKSNVNFNHIQRFSLYRAINTLCLNYKNQSLNAVYGGSAVCSEIHTEDINTLCGQNVEFLNVTPGDTSSTNQPLKG